MQAREAASGQDALGQRPFTSLSAEHDSRHGLVMISLIRLPRSDSILEYSERIQQGSEDPARLDRRVSTPEYDNWRMANLGATVDLRDDALPISPFCPIGSSGVDC